MFLQKIIKSLFISEPCKKTKVLFFVKKRTLPHYSQVGKTVSTGLKTSATFVVEMLNSFDSTEAKLVEVIDNNCIDREVKVYQPDIVVIEALWVVPEKFAILKKLHPKVKWVIRLHSETTFIANEGNAFHWIHECAKIPSVYIGVNSERMFNHIYSLIGIKNIVLLPNYYPLKELPYGKKQEKGIIHIGCFGAIRPMKNHLIQAVAAIHFANSKGFKLYFHINGNRCEENGDPVLKNLRSLFNHSTHELVEHAWLDHAEFVQLLRSIDLCSQVSLSETFNIVTADAVSQNVPVVTSPEITWVNKLFTTAATDLDGIISAFNRAWLGKKVGLQRLNYWGLQEENEHSKCIWKHQLEKVLK